MLRRGLYPLLAGSWVAVVLFSGGCIDEPKRIRPGAGAAGMAGARAPVAGKGGGEVIGEGGAAGEAEAGAGGSLDAGTGGVGEEAGGAAGEGGAQAGAGGEGGEIDTFAEPCPSSALQGWASVPAYEFDPSLNQPTPLDVWVSNALELTTYAASPEPYIIHVSGTIAVSALDVKSNKTIVGMDRDATIEGGIRVAGTSTAAADMVSNVVIKNLRIKATNSLTSIDANEPDGITIAYAHHVWIDHVDIWDAVGDAIDVRNGSDHVTISWSKFRFVDGLRRTGVRVGHADDNAAEDLGRLKVTLHHNWFTDSVDQRMPRVRFGSVHVFGNYFSHPETGVPNSYCVAAAIESRLLVENNYFEHVQYPHVFFSFVGSTPNFAEPTAQMVANGNTYIGISDEPGGKQSGQGEAFTPPYAVTLEPADTQLKAFVRHCTGALTAPPPAE